MSLYDRRVLLLGFAALGSCGFEPAFGTGNDTNQLRGSVLIDRPSDRASFQLMQRMEARLGRAQTPKYRLSVALDLKQEGLAISGSNNIRRYNLIGVAAYSLRDFSSGELLTRGRVENFTAYSASQQPVSTRSAERDARERLVVTLADKITTQLVLRARQFQ